MRGHKDSTVGRKDREDPVYRKLPVQVLEGSCEPRFLILDTERPRPRTRIGYDDNCEFSVRTEHF